MTKSTRTPLESEHIALAQELSPNGFRAKQHTRDRPNSGTETRAQNGPIFRAQKQGQQNVTQLLGDTFSYPECGPENGICFKPRETSAVTGGFAKRITPQPAHKETTVLSKNPCRDHLHPTLGMQQKHELIDSTPCTRMSACSRLGNTDKLQFQKLHETANRCDTHGAPPHEALHPCKDERAHVRSHARTHARTDAHARSQARTHARTHAHMHARTHAHAQAHTHACTQAGRHAGMPSRLHARTHTHARVHL